MQLLDVETLNTTMVCGYMPVDHDQLCRNVLID